MMHNQQKRGNTMNKLRSKSLCLTGSQRRAVDRLTSTTAWTITLVLFVSLAGGCSGFGARREYAYRSSVVEYLYPDAEVAEVPDIPRLALPLNVGVAFVPEADGPSPTYPLSEKQKMDLMERIASEFRALPFVNHIELIPTAYLAIGGGFTNLDQIRTMYNVDVIALLSHDQVQHTDQGMLSLAYWTIVGAYVIKGERNDTNTMVDAAVYDIRSRKMLFRAPGLSHIKGSATFVNLSEQLRTDASDGFRLAADNLVVNLKDELDRFEQKVKQMPEAYAVVHKPGYTGGGSIGGGYAVMLLLFGGLAVWRSRKAV